jgi:hypothetical protein
MASADASTAPANYLAPNLLNAGADFKGLPAGENDRLSHPVCRAGQRACSPARQCRSYRAGVAECGSGVDRMLSFALKRRLGLQGPSVPCPVSESSRSTSARRADLARDRRDLTVPTEMSRMLAASS